MTDEPDESFGLARSGPRALQVRAANAAAHTRSLASLAPAWRSEVHRFAGGWLVLAGVGMYVNQAMVAGLADEVSSSDLDLLIERSEAVGVVPAIEVTAGTQPESVRRIRRRGFVDRPDTDIACLTRAVAGATVDAPDDVLIRPVVTDAELGLWQRTSAAGWQHTSDDAHRASEAFAAAAHALANEHFVVAFDADDERPLGCAAMTVRDGVAMLGGMSTIPAERRRGVQAALLRYRIAAAGRMGCDLAITTAACDSASERNLRRHGFAPTGVIRRFVPSSATD
ncbi:MAG: GNAT family N-acetyltransferase [Actinomycetota bacterium]